MRFTSTGLIKGIIVSAVLCVLVLSGLRALGMFGAGDSGNDPETLARRARNALEAVKKRQPGDRRPASYDQVLAPLDELLKQARDLTHSETYNPAADYEKVRAIVLPVIEISTLAEAQAKTETGYLTKEYRFNDQRGEACQYLAAALWERINAQRPGSQGYFGETQSLPAADMNELRRILDAGIEAAPGNRNLWYLRGVLNRAEGLFGPAAGDLEKAVALDPSYPAAWNTLGLVRINLKEFDGAEEALERARQLALDEASKFNAQPGPEYVAIIYNLAMFHENLASYYVRENRINPTVEARRLANKHVADARKYLEEFLAREPAGTPDARTAQAKLAALPK